MDRESLYEGLTMMFLPQPRIKGAGDWSFSTYSLWPCYTFKLSITVTPPVIVCMCLAHGVALLEDVALLE